MHTFVNNIVSLTHVTHSVSGVTTSVVAAEFSIYVGQGAISGQSCWLWSHEGGPATLSMDAKMILTLGNITACHVSVLLLPMGHQGTEAETFQ